MKMKIPSTEKIIARTGDVSRAYEKFSEEVLENVQEGLEVKITGFGNLFTLYHFENIFTNKMLEMEPLKKGGYITENGKKIVLEGNLIRKANEKDLSYLIRREIK